MKNSINFETFTKFGACEVSRLTEKEPTCFNGLVQVRKYRVTVEPVEEPIEVLAARLKDLWETCDNHHHYSPLKATADGLGIDVSDWKFGSRRVRL